MDVRAFLGKNIGRIRLEKGLTQAKLAEELDIDRAYVSSLERGQRNPTVVTLWQIARVLDVEFVTLFQTPESSEGPTSAPKAGEIKARKSRQANSSS